MHSLPIAQICTNMFEYNNIPIAAVYSIDNIVNEKNNNHINRPRILVWFHCQILPATIYKNVNKLDYDIHVIDSNTTINKSDIVYNFS